MNIKSIPLGGNPVAPVLGEIPSLIARCILLAHNNTSPPVVPEEIEDVIQWKIFKSVLARHKTWVSNYTSCYKLFTVRIRFSDITVYVLLNKEDNKPLFIRSHSKSGNIFYDGKWSFSEPKQRWYRRG